MNSRAQGLHSPRDTVPAKMQYFLQAMLMAKPYTPWPNKNASILFGIVFQKLINKNE